MPSFSQSSQDKLATCHQDLQTVFQNVIKHRDCIVVYGYRSPEEQNELYQQGRTKPGKVVTYLDGHQRKSNHNYNPSRAVDVMPYFDEEPHIRWDDIDSMKEFAGFVQGVATMLRAYGTIEHDVDWGGNWKSFKDYPHYELA